MTSTMTLDFFSFFFRCEFDAISNNLVQDVYKIEKKIYVEKKIIKYLTYHFDEPEILGVLRNFYLKFYIFILNLLILKIMASKIYP